MRVLKLTRAEFFGCYFDYQPGESLAAFEPTQQGKTHFLYEAADAAMRQHPELSFASLMPKAVSPATRAWARRLDLRIVEDWPPAPHVPLVQKPPRGHVLWPPHLRGATVAQNREHLAGVFRGALTRRLRTGNGITLADDVHVLVLMGLNAELEEHLTTGGEAGAGLWLAQQKTSGTRAGSLTTYAYNQPKHLILGHDPVPENRRRYSDFDGVDPGQVAYEVARLEKHRIETPYGYKNISEKLYIRTDGPYMAIVLPW